jgi:hypothetical protein
VSDASDDVAAVRKLEELASQLDNAKEAGKEVVKQVSKARQKAAKATKLIESAAARRKRMRLRAGKKR